MKRKNDFNHWFAEESPLMQGHRSAVADDVPSPIRSVPLAKIPLNDVAQGPAGRIWAVSTAVHPACPAFVAVVYVFGPPCRTLNRPHPLPHWAHLIVFLLILTESYN
jgi:hypothetical protein